MLTKLEFNEVFKEMDGNFHSMAKKLTNEFIKHRNVQLAYLQIKWFKSHSHYRMYQQQYSFLMYDNLRLLDFNEEALEEFNIQIKTTHINSSLLIKHLINLSRNLKRNVVNSIHVQRLSFQNRPVLTKFGQENIENILRTLDVIIQTECTANFFSDFYVFNEDGFKKATLPVEHYYKFYQIGKQSEEKLKLETDKIYKREDGTAIEKSVENSIFQHCTNLMREAENTYRVSISGKKIGEGFIRETELYYKIKSYFSNIEVKQHGRPHFLGRQHFDVWIPELKIALEYHGEQHDRPVVFFGGEEAFLKNQKRDEEKKRKCLENDIVMIELRIGYDFLSLIKEIKSICSAKNIEIIKNR
jgi:hypothetical protein